ncbi:hypothetical protein EXIGLDRAFT_585591, partial [Exidia glandulosa HHB12029]
GKRIWRCMDCLLSPTTCAAELVRDHARCPFHRVQKWNGLYFERSSLSAAGLVVHLGHHGERCPRAPKGDDLKFMIGHTTGIHKVPLSPCSCLGCGDLIAQLVRSKLMPATTHSPRTAFTFALLDDLHMDTVQGKKPLFDYWTKIVRLTRNVDVNADKKTFESLGLASRFYRAVTRKRQSGQAFDIDEVLLKLYPGLTYPGSMIPLCPCCPHPGFNMEKGW